jgi:uncharacterized protein YndB with AHSA1/START domain
MKPEQQTSLNEPYGVSTEAGTVRLERRLPGPIERVWQYLTDAEKRGKWFAAGPMDLRPGGRIEFHFHNSDLTPQHEPIPEKFKHEKQTSNGTVIKCHPPKLLSFSWEEMSGGESEVTFELSESNKEVLMVITHRRLRNREEMVGVAAGWHTHVNVLSDVLNERELRPFWSSFLELEKTYDERIPK